MATGRARNNSSTFGPENTNSREGINPTSVVTVISNNNTQGQRVVQYRVETMKSIDKHFVSIIIR